MQLRGFYHSLAVVNGQTVLPVGGPLFDDGPSVGRRGEDAHSRQVTEDASRALSRLAPYSFLVCFSASIPGCMRVAVHRGDGEVEYVRIGISIREGEDGPEPMFYSFAGQWAGGQQAGARRRQGLKAARVLFSLVCVCACACVDGGGGADPFRRPATGSIAELLERVYAEGPGVQFRAGAIVKDDLEVAGDRYGVKYHRRSAVMAAPEVIQDDGDGDGDGADDDDDDSFEVRHPQVAASQEPSRR
jgi:hypothetical protein